MAQHGGVPVRTQPWPQWPQSTAKTEQALLTVMRSGRWSVSGLETDGGPTWDRRFAEAFARYNGVGFCVPTVNGTNALMCAMQALGIGVGDEVIVPGLTWVACASAVLAVNAIPVIVDIDPLSLCLDPAAVEAAIGPRTRAIMAVHLYNAIADLDALLALAQRHRLDLIEDCAQAHGARWRGRRVGSVGTVGTFSMQNGKVLTSGEGGACICDDPHLAARIFRLHADGRRLRAEPALPGYMSLEEDGHGFARNACLSELQAAVLLSRLEDLDKENAQRAHQARALRGHLREIGGFTFQHSAPGTEATTLYHFPVRLEAPEFAGISAAKIAAALSAELGCWVHTPYPPMDEFGLLDPGSPPRLPAAPRVPEPLRNARAAHRQHVVLPHWLFLTDGDAMAQIADAFAKVKQHAGSLRAIEGEV
nr:DegT/DnrJ/EryC1/StrS family aminotransferase [Pseudomonas lactucae]